MANRSGLPYSSPRDSDRNPASLGVSSANPNAVLPLTVDSATGALKVTTAGAGTGSTTITDGTNTVNVVSGDTGYNGIATTGSVKTVTFTTSTPGAQTLIPDTDVRGYTWMEITYTSVGVGLALTAQHSPASGGAYLNHSSWSQSSTTLPASALGVTTGLSYTAAVRGNFFQIAISALTSGTVTGTLILRAFPPAFSAVAASQNGVWTVGSNSATGSAVPANAFLQGVSDGTNLIAMRTVAAAGDGTALPIATGGYSYNGTSWDKSRAVTNATNSTGTGIAAAGLVAQLDDTSPTTITENQFGNLRMTADRSLIVSDRSTTPTQTSVVGSATTVTVLAANNARKGATVFNDSSAVLYLKLGATASTTSYTLQIAANGYYEVPFGYVGIIDGIWASATGNARVTEIA